MILLGSSLDSSDSDHSDYSQSSQSSSESSQSSESVTLESFFKSPLYIYIWAIVMDNLNLKRKV